MGNMERHGMKGRLTLVLRDEHGREVERREVDNLITDAGRALVAQFVTGVIQGTPRLFIAVGTGKKDDTSPVNAPDVKDMALSKQVDRAEATVAVKNSVATVTATLRAAGSGAVQPLAEAGIQVEVSGRPPVLYNRVTFDVVNKSPNMEMTLSWEVTF
jgi:hypothetical protein